MHGERADDDGTVLVTSPDGITWQRVEIVATSATGERYPNVIANCSSLIADGDRLIAGGRDVGQGHVLAIGSDGQGDDLLALTRSQPDR